MSSDAAHQATADEPEFDASNPETHHQSKLMEFILSDKAATVQSLLGGDPKKPQFVRHYTETITYDVYRLKGIEAKINVESYDKYVERMEKMEQAETKDGKKQYTKEDVKKFIRATCFNKCKAVRDELATREDFITMAQFIEKILFDQDQELREKPPKGFTKVTVISKSYVWESKKFIVKCSTDSYLQLEINVRKLKKKAKKEDAFNVVAETKKVVFLQKNMKLVAGEYCSGAEYAAYYKILFKEMFPKEFGSEKGLKKDTDGIKPEDKQIDEAQTELPIDEPEEDIQEDEEPEEELADEPPKKKRGRPKGSKNKKKP